MTWKLADGPEGEERTGDAITWLDQASDVRAVRGGAKVKMQDPLIRFYLDALRCAAQWEPEWVSTVQVPDEDGLLQLAKWAGELAVQAGHRSGRPEARDVVSALLERCSEEGKVRRG